MLQLSDLIANYPPQDTDHIQTIVASKKEFRDLSSYENEPAPEPGKFYTYQQLITRLMIPYDSLLLYWNTGVGKSGAMIGLAEYFHDLYDKNPKKAPIRKAIFLTKGKGLRDTIQLEIACKFAPNKYITPGVLSATKEQARKSALSKALSKFWLITTYKKFSLSLKKKKTTSSLESLSDEEIKKKYSRVLFFIDEVHNINADIETGLIPTEKKRIYQQLWRLFHLIEGSKIILASASPMVNEAKEIAPLMNLILPRDMQMPSIDYNTVTIHDVEPYFRGRISYVKASEVGVHLVPQGEVFNFSFDTPEGTRTTPVTLTTSGMKDIQLRGYLNAKEVATGVFDTQRQAANFIFPDGSWGGDFPRRSENPEKSLTFGLGKYVTSPHSDTYRITPELFEWISDLTQLARLSSKFAHAINEVMAGTLGTVFIYNDFVFGSGTILHGLCFEANGFERFKGSSSAFESTEGLLPPLCSFEPEARRLLLTPKLRYAMITNETSPAAVTRILELFNSPENVHGGYLKVLLGSQITREGLSLSHVTQIHLMTTWWNRSANYQALSRAVRATSHLLLLEEVNGRVEVKTYRHVAIANNNPNISIDVYTNQLATTKDFPILRMENFMKKLAIDCLVNTPRNKVDCYNPPPNLIDRSTFDVYYIEKIIYEATSRLSEFFTLRFSFTRDELYFLLNDFLPHEVDRALAKIIDEKRIIFDRYGFISYLREDGNRFFLQRDFPVRSEIPISHMVTTYTADLIATQEIPLTQYNLQLDVDNQNVIIESLLSLPENSPRFLPLFEKLTPESRVNLFEMMVYTYSNGVVTPNLERVIEFYSSYFYIVKEPTGILAALQGSPARGRPPKEGRQRKVKISPSRLEHSVETIEITDVPGLISTGQEIVFLHTLYNLLFGRTSYNVSTRFKKAGENLRILKLSEGQGWRNILPHEIAVYGIIINRISTRRTATFENVPIYGVIIEGKFKVVDRTAEAVRMQKGTSKVDLRTRKTGISCISPDKPEIIDVFWKLQVPPHEFSGKIPEEREELINYLFRKRSLSARSDYGEWSDERLNYYAQWAHYNKGQLCKILEEYFRENNLLLIL